jgi:hypothetical protein
MPAVRRERGTHKERSVTGMKRRSSDDERYGVDQVTLDLFSSEGAPSPVDLHPERVTRSLPFIGRKRRYLPLWRLFDVPE